MKERPSVKKNNNNNSRHLAGHAPTVTLQKQAYAELLLLEKDFPKVRLVACKGN